MKSNRHRSQTWTRLHKGMYISFVVLGCICGAVVLLFPSSIASVNSNLENVQEYFAAQKIAQEKAAVQKTLALGEEVLDVYQDTPTYFQVTDTCDWEFLGGDCVVARTGPGSSYPEAYLYYEHLGTYPVRIRQGQVFLATALIKTNDGSLWYKIFIDKTKLSFSERVKTDWYVPAAHFIPINTTPIDPEKDVVKRIVIVIHSQELSAYEGQALFMKAKVSTGTEDIGLGTDMGDFHIFRKTPMAIMEGPLLSMADMVTPDNLANFEYTLFVPYAMAFEITSNGISFIHDAYWHNGFGSERSHGCVNLSYQDAVTLYNWTPDPAVIKIPVSILP